LSLTIFKEVLGRGERSSGIPVGTSWVLAGPLRVKLGIGNALKGKDETNNKIAAEHLKGAVGHEPLKH